ncbi:hypothetical protein Tco_1425762 [Tanacetum coccineum]
MSLPPALANLIGTTHILEIKSHTYYEYGTFESFTCWTIVRDEGVDESACSSTLDEIADTESPKLKKLARRPSVPPPSKPLEERTIKRVDIDDSDSKDIATYKHFPRVEMEDSDTEVSCGSAQDGQKNKIGSHSDKEKRRRYVSDEE